jgi:transposase
MEKYTTFIGIDLGDRFSHLYVTDSLGAVLKEFKVKTERTALVLALESWPRSRVALEAGTHSLWSARALARAGHDVIVANPRQLALIHASMKKCDAVDARTLARLVRLDVELLSPVHVRSEQSQAHLELIKARDALVRTRTALVNHVRGAVKSMGYRVASCSAVAFAKQAKEQLPPALREALLPLLRALEEINGQIKVYDKRIAAVSQVQYPVTELLRSIPGVGPITALAYTLTVEDPRRFSSGRQVGAYLGLTPRRDQSGERDPQLRITKAGDSFLRRLLVSAAQYILGSFAPDSALRQWGLRKAAGGKAAKRKAVVAVARKLCALLHSLWRNGTTYELFPPAPEEFSSGLATQPGVV